MKSGSTLSEDPCDNRSREVLEGDIMSYRRFIVMFSTASLIALTAWAGIAVMAQDAGSGQRAPAQITADLKDEHGRTALMRAALKGDRADVQGLLDGGADVNATTEAGVTALMLAAGEGHAEVLQTLIAKSADVNARTPGGYTALMCAALNGHTDAVRVLLDNGADVTIKDTSDQTALKYAESKAHTEIIELLTRAGNKSSQ
jgi:ankyrin repeat protein